MPAIFFLPGSGVLRLVWVDRCGGDFCWLAADRNRAAIVARGVL